MNVTSFLHATVVAGTPLLLATLGEILTEKVGNLNLGVEGMMLLGAVMGFIVGYNTGNPVLALLAAMAAGAFGGFVYSTLTVSLRANQVVTGLTLTIFGAGVSSLLGQKVVGQVVPAGIRNFFAPKFIHAFGKHSFYRRNIFHSGCVCLYIICFNYSDRNLCL